MNRTQLRRGWEPPSVAAGRECIAKHNISMSLRNVLKSHFVRDHQRVDQTVEITATAAILSVPHLKATYNVPVRISPRPDRMSPAARIHEESGCHVTAILSTAHPTGIQP